MALHPLAADSTNGSATIASIIATDNATGTVLVKGSRLCGPCPFGDSGCDGDADPQDFAALQETLMGE